MVPCSRLHGHAGTDQSSVLTTVLKLKKNNYQLCLSLNKFKCSIRSFFWISIPLLGLGVINRIFTLS